MMKEYYKQRWHWVFNYTSKNFGYCLLKTLCLIIGLPIYSVMFLVEMLLTGINMIFSWIPILNTVVYVICKALMVAFGSTFYICILTDIKRYKQEVALLSQQADGDLQELEYQVVDEEGADNSSDVTALTPSDNSQQEGSDE